MGTLGRNDYVGRLGGETQSLTTTDKRIVAYSRGYFACHVIIGYRRVVIIVIVIVVIVMKAVVTPVKQVLDSLSLPNEDSLIARFMDPMH